MTARLVLLISIAACTTSLDHAPPPPDATAFPTSPAGIFRITSTFDLAQAPPAAAPFLTALADATDDPDDPGRYLVERVIAALPDGTTKQVALDLEPVLAAYVQAEIADVAPRLAPGLSAMARGMERFASHFDTLELWHVELSGATTRVVTGVEFDGVAVAFDAAGMPDRFAAASVALDLGALAVSDHELALPYGALLRLALDRAVVPAVDPGATDLARALADLVDCHKLGTGLATAVGFGTGSFYAAACETALTEAADDLYARLAAIDAAPVSFSLSGTARGIDTDGDGAMDAIEDGSWTGTLDAGGARSPLGTGTFSGTR